MSNLLRHLCDLRQAGKYVCVSVYFLEEKAIYPTTLHTYYSDNNVMIMKRKSNVF